ncbi:Uncharacterized protein Rs2_06766 [Raphanus sativus]|uniref:Uncharacterized protein LOC108834308 n=1 Tax=Raphanus sativus TaxID=3726 RepID=A0A6J0LTQ2_RAPSA|nr:uncharacterized protein LOC108834308 [Raphanus sativus]XP_056858257.1 uncharacterized protein LOC130507577 [Raphanus sativus]KAJ4865885.1 Uncharacterized protein Rs2_52597 [Raphanus sativus]KAJ4912145.1 Uncharacterized protein Rs2_06766 [Raphanus sativus]
MDVNYPKFYSLKPRYISGPEVTDAIGKEDSDIPASAHPTHVPALCSERLSWMKANDVNHSEPYQLIRNRKFEYLSFLLDTKLSKLDKYQKDFDDGTNRVAYYALPFFSCSSLNQLISLMRRMITVARWAEIARCTSPQVLGWVVTVSKNLMPRFDALFIRLPSQEDEPEHWCRVSSELYLAAQQVLGLLQQMKEARVKLARIHVSLGIVPSDEDKFMMRELKAEIELWRPIEREALKWIGEC